MTLPRFTDTARILVRLGQVAYELSRGLLLYGICRALERLQLKGGYGRSSSSCLVATLERLGPISTKAGQILASRPDLLGNALCASLKRLQTGVKPLPFSTVLRIIERNFGNLAVAGLDRVEAEPIAAGLIAQVHRARTCSGAQIVLKVLRPDIRRRISLDLLVMRGAAAAFDWLRLFPSLQAEQLCREVEDTYLRQTDLLSEAENAEKFAQNFREWPQVVVPRIVREKTCPDILAMEYLPALDPRKPACRSPNSVLGLQTLYKMIFVDGFVHADLHSGNVAFDEHCVYLVDFGLVAALSNVARADFCELFIAMATGDAARCAKIALKYSEAKGARPDPCAFQHEIETRLAEFSGRSVREFEAARFAHMIFDVQRRFGLVGSNTFAMTILALVTFEGVLKGLDPALDFQNEGMRFLMNQGGEAMPRERRVGIYADLREEVHRKLARQLQFEL